MHNNNESNCFPTLALPLPLWKIVTSLQNCYYKKIKVTAKKVIICNALLSVPGRNATQTEFLLNVCRRATLKGFSYTRRCELKAIWSGVDINRYDVWTKLLMRTRLVLVRNDWHLNEVSRQRRKITLYKHISQITA